MRYLYLLLTLVLVSCGTDSHHFKIDGRLLNLNQGEFYVYSTDGVIEGIDTIHVQAGRFSYETKCEKKGTLVIVFPNFSEQPVFTEPGKIASFEGDVNKLKEVKVKGTDDNKIMNLFRERAINSSPDEIKKYIEQITNDHPTSIVPIYLVRKYFMQTDVPDYKRASKLLGILQKAQPENGLLKIMEKQVKNYANSSVKEKLPEFTATDVNGKKVSSKDYTKGQAAIIVWASWEYESCNMLRTLRDIKKDNEDIHVLGICLDTSIKECKRIMERDEINFPIVCDGKMMDGSLVQKLATCYIPDNIILKDGKVTARTLATQELRKKMR